MKLLEKIFPKKTFYQIVGKEEGVKRLVSNFYNVMENDRLARECLLTHELDAGEIPQEIKDKLFMFLSGWFGGPNLFMENIGHPRMRARHSHVKISERERDQWLYCMEKALNSHNPKIKDKDYKNLMNSFMALAYRIQNTQLDSN